jgi:hypothetical protein
MPELGTCKLCLTVRPLQKSHILSQAVYRYCRADDLKNPNPVIIVPDNIAQKSTQFWQYLLCAECEGLFDRKGEKWVNPKLLTYEGLFPLYDEIITSPSIDWDGMKVYDAKVALGPRVDDLAYYGLSTLWRAAVSNRGVCKLGPYAEPLRLHLLQFDPLPPEIDLVVTIGPPGSAKCIATLPSSKKADGYHTHEFIVPGVQFLLFTGRKIPADVADSSLTRNARVYVSAEVHSHIVRDTAKITSGIAQRTGFVSKPLVKKP